MRRCRSSPTTPTTADRPDQQDRPHPPDHPDQVRDRNRRGLDQGNGRRPRHDQEAALRAHPRHAGDRRDRAQSDDVPAYDPASLIDSTQPIMAPDDTNTAIYGAESKAKSRSRPRALPTTLAPPKPSPTRCAEAYVRQTLLGVNNRK